MGDELVLDVFGLVLREGLRRQAAAALGTNTTEVILDTDQGGVLAVDSRGIKTSAAKRFAPSYSALDFAVLGGGSLLDRARTRWGEFCQAVRARRPASNTKRRGLVPMYIHASGTQMDSTRNEFFALQCIRKPSFGGFRGPETVAMLTELAAAWTRHHGRNRDPARYFGLDLPIISDSGILTSRVFPRHVGPLVKQVDDNTSPSGVICLSGLPNGLDAVKLARAWAENYTVVLMPVDHVTFHKLKGKLAVDLGSDVDPRVRSRIILNPHVTHYGVWLALLDRCDVMLTSRLHAMILSASTQTRFRLFQESRRRSQIKMQDFITNTFGEKMESFRLPDGWQGSMSEVAELFSEKEVGRWSRRYDQEYEAREIEKPYEAHVREMGKLLDYILPSAKYRGVTRGVRVTVKRFFDGATIEIRLK